VGALNSFRTSATGSPLLPPVAHRYACRDGRRPLLPQALQLPLLIRWSVAPWKCLAGAVPDWLWSRTSALAVPQTSAGHGRTRARASDRDAMRFILNANQYFVVAINGAGLPTELIAFTLATDAKPAGCTGERQPAWMAHFRQGIAASPRQNRDI